MSRSADARAKFALVFDVGCELGWDLHNFVFERRVRIAASGRSGFLDQKVLYMRTGWGGRILHLEGFGVTHASPDLRNSWIELAPQFRALLRHRPKRDLETVFTANLVGMSEVVDLLRAFDASIPFLSGESARPPQLRRSRFAGRDQDAVRSALRSLLQRPLRLPAEYALAFQPRRPRRARNGWGQRPFMMAIPEGIEAGLVVWTQESGTSARREARTAIDRLRRASFEGDFHRTSKEPGLVGYFHKRPRTRERLLDVVRFASEFRV